MWGGGGGWRATFSMTAPLRAKAWHPFVPHAAQVPSFLLSALLQFERHRLPPLRLAPPSSLLSALDPLLPGSSRELLSCTSGWAGEEGRALKERRAR